MCFCHSSAPVRLISKELASIGIKHTYVFAWTCERCNYGKFTPMRIHLNYWMPNFKLLIAHFGAFYTWRMNESNYITSIE